MKADGTQKQTRAQQYRRAAKEMGVSLFIDKEKGIVDKAVLSTIRDMIGPPDSPTSNIKAGQKNAFGGKLDMTA